MEIKELIQSGLANTKRSIDRALNGLTPEELSWQPAPDANSIQIVLFHNARLEDNTIQARLQNKPQLWDSQMWYRKLNKDVKDSGGHYTLDDVKNFKISDTKDLTTYMDALRNNTLEYIKGLKEGDFDRKITLAPMGPPPPGGAARPPMELTVGTMLLMMVTHLAQHAGEIGYIRGLKRGMDK